MSGMSLGLGRILARSRIRILFFRGRIRSKWTGSANTSLLGKQSPFKKKFKNLTFVLPCGTVQRVRQVIRNKLLGKNVFVFFLEIRFNLIYYRFNDRISLIIIFVFKFKKIPARFFS
jgi:hypothetical protein